MSSNSWCLSLRCRWTDDSCPAELAVCLKSFCFVSPMCRAVHPSLRWTASTALLRFCLRVLSFGCTNLCLRVATLEMNRNAMLVKDPFCQTPATQGMMTFLLFWRSNTTIYVHHIPNDTDVLSLNTLCDMLNPFEYKWLSDKRFLNLKTPISHNIRQ